VDHNRPAVDAALDLLSKCINDVAAFDDSGSFDESDLLHAVGRLQKIVGVLVPVTRRAAYLEQIDHALRVTAAERKAEALVVHVLPGPFLGHRAKRLIHIAEGLRDDFTLGRLSRAQSSIHGPAVAEKTPHNPAEHRPAADTNTSAPPFTAGGAGEAPPLVKGILWCWTNLRSRPGWAILGLCVIASPLLEPIVGSYWINRPQATHLPDQPNRSTPVAAESTPPAAPASKPDSDSCLAFLGTSRTLMASATVIDRATQSSGHVPGEGKQVDTLELTVEKLGPEMARFTGRFVRLHARALNERLVGTLDGANFSYEHTFELVGKGGTFTEKVAGHCLKSAMQGIVRTTRNDRPPYNYVSEIALTK
jgi:hypothetical protein